MTKNYSYIVDFKALDNGVNELSFDIKTELFAMFEGSEINNGNGKIVVTINKNDNVATMKTNIDACVQLQCDRCLDLMDVDVNCDYQCAIKVSDQENQYDGDVLWLNPNDQKLDLVQYFYENIVLSLPIARTHADFKDCNQDVVKFISGQE